jgi:D-tyrosyl-tRNA(Tyr) deacylase
MSPHAAREEYAALVARLRAGYRADCVKDGIFGAMMHVRLENDGPVTIVLDSQARE